MTKSLVLPGLIVATSLACALGGCVVRGSGGLYVRPAAVVVIEEEPPPPRVEYYEPRPGQIWLTGRWYRQGNRWQWRAGHWERERVGYHYAPGRWERRGKGHVWVDGRWNQGGHNGPKHIKVDNKKDKDNGGNVKVRDHRR